MSKSKPKEPSFRLELSAQDVDDVAEALEQFIDSTPEELVTEQLQDLFRRAESLKAKVHGEPEEGY